MATESEREVLADLISALGEASAFARKALVGDADAADAKLTKDEKRDLAALVEEAADLACELEMTK